MASALACGMGSVAWRRAPARQVQRTWRRFCRALHARVTAARDGGAWRKSRRTRLTKAVTSTESSTVHASARIRAAVPMAYHWQRIRLAHEGHSRHTASNVSSRMSPRHSCMRVVMCVGMDTRICSVWALPCPCRTGSVTCAPGAGPRAPPAPSSGGGGGGDHGRGVLRGPGGRARGARRMSPGSPAGARSGTAPPMLSWTYWNVYRCSHTPRSCAALRTVPSDTHPQARATHKSRPGARHSSSDCICRFSYTSASSSG